MRTMILCLVMAGLIALVPTAGATAPAGFSAPTDQEINAARRKANRVKIDRSRETATAEPIDIAELEKINDLPPLPEAVPLEKTLGNDRTGDDKAGGDGRPARDNQVDRVARIPTKRPTEPAPAKISFGNVSGSVRLKRLKGFGDYAGRGETPRSDGSPEANLILTLNAPGRTLTGLTLRAVDNGQPIWDTVPGNRVWLVAVTDKGKRLNNKDGSLALKLGPDHRRLDLWVQDNHTLARGGRALELVADLDGKDRLILPVEDKLKR